MLEKVRLALRITTTAYDYELARLIEAGAKDLETAGIHAWRNGEAAAISDLLDMRIGNGGKIVDKSELRDSLMIQAIITYVRMNFGSPSDYDRLRESYDLQKVQMMHADGYTNYAGGESA